MFEIPQKQDMSADLPAIYQPFTSRLPKLSATKVPKSDFTSSAAKASKAPRAACSQASPNLRSVIKTPGFFGCFKASLLKKYSKSINF